MVNTKSLQDKSISTGIHRITEINHFVAQNTPTPFFLLDLNVIRERLVEFTQLFSSVDVFYSTKTNPHPAILELVAQSGHGFDVATVGEIQQVLQCGARPEKLLYTHPIKTIDEVQAAYKLGVRQFTSDSLEDLCQLVSHAPGAMNFIRIQPIGNASLYNYKRKFGATTQELITIMDFAVTHNIPIHGLSFMVGSQSMSCDPWSDTLDYVRYLISRYYAKMPTLKTINIGSGFPVAYGFNNTVPSLQQIASIVDDFARQIPADIKLIAEPGRCIAAPATTLITRIVQRVARTGQQWLYTDANAYSGLIEVIENGGHFPYRITSDHTSSPEIFSVAGKTLDPDDMLGKDVPLGKTIGAGDLLYVHDVGAYSSSFFTSYHSLPRPSIVIHDSEFSHNVSLTTQSSMDIAGLKARRTLSAGDLIFRITGTTSLQRSRTTFQTSLDSHIEPNLYGAFLNHSCEPHAGVRTNKSGQLEIIARRHIESGSDIMVDYAMFEYETVSMAKVRCQCESTQCRGYITGYKHLPQVFKDRYTGCIARHLL